MKKIVIMLMAILLLFAMIGCGSEGSSDVDQYKAKMGELQSVTENENLLVVKVKITSSYNTEKTINQNYHNVEDLIVNQGCDKFNEIQYWAVADMNDGSEEKVISFTVDSNTIKGVAERNISATQLGDYVKDLWIHQSLQ